MYPTFKNTAPKCTHANFKHTPHILPTYLPIFSQSIKTYPRTPPSSTTARDPPDAFSSNCRNNFPSNCAPPTHSLHFQIEYPLADTLHDPLRGQAHANISYDQKDIQLCSWMDGLIDRSTNFPTNTSNCCSTFFFLSFPFLSFPSLPKQLQLVYIPPVYFSRCRIVKSETNKIQRFFSTLRRSYGCDRHASFRRELSPSSLAANSHRKRSHCLGN